MQEKPGSARNLDILCAWQEQMRDAAHESPLQQQLVRQEYTLLPQFGEHAALPRRARRGLQRRWKCSLAGVALLTALNVQPASAVVINVGGGCTLADAITSANDDASPGACADGSGADTLVLPAGSTQTLTQINNTTGADNGLPVITGSITIQGNGSTITRALTAPFFRIFDVAAGARLSLQQVTVSGGNSSGPGGGLINAGTVVVTDSTFSNNRTTLFGGGVANRLNATFTMSNSTLSDNRATDEGGGVDNEGTLTISNSTISGNSAGTQGGGVSNFNAAATVTLIHATVTGNTATIRGAGVGNIGELNVSRSLVSGNAGTPIGREVFHSTGPVVANFNLFGTNGLPGVTGFVPIANNVVPPAGTLVADILNDSLADNPPGTTQTHALIAGSPALDAVIGPCPPLATDQRGVTRPQGASCDIGSFELESDVLSPPPPPPPLPPPPLGNCRGIPATIVGTPGPDVLTGTLGADVIQGLAGKDRLIGLAGDDIICGGEDRDNIYGGPGNDKLYGELGNDRLLGVDGNDALFGGSERDNLNGGIGADTCNGGAPRRGDAAVNCETLSNVP